MTQHDPELQNLIDEAAIRRLLANYPRAIDRQDFTLLASLFHSDAIAAADALKLTIRATLPGTQSWRIDDGRR